MSGLSNKEVVEKYFELINRSDETGILALLADDFEIISMNRNPSFLRYRWNANQFAAAPKLMSKYMKKPILMRLIAMTAEGDRVAVEADSYGEMINGKVYENSYHFLFVLKEGKILEVREYCCSYTAQDVFGEYLSESGEYAEG